MKILTKAVRLALAGSVLALGASTAEAAITMYNTYTTTDQNATDGWTHANGSTNSGQLQPWVGIPNATDQPLGFHGGHALSWAIQLTSAGDSGVISTADSQQRYGFAAEIDTAQGAWQDNSGSSLNPPNPLADTGWRHQTDFGIIKSDVTQTVRISASVVDGAFPSLFGITLYQGMDTSNFGSWSHHGNWNAGYVAGRTTTGNLSKVNGNNAVGIPGLIFLDFIDSSGLGPHGGTVLEFTALAGQVYTVALGGRAGGSWNGTKASYELNVAAVPVPATVWLFGTALGAVGWAGGGRRRIARKD
ncbi:hypothetical protein IVG45_13895 [Methylomonas sp. LL1]|uniref:hypothetical protein n=1 Tax=Methylomonas sp. LL1 TaxID=2785785 RepID=UPI0018C3CEC0|nr:hypothetical protein [Methylomonas sp. LL1]QPK61951.1 hypothetical protein IVG45_13895 [Methylomonas sp. LL1]